MDFDRAAFFISGLLVGSFLDRLTTLILMGTWITIRNGPLPNYLGGGRPQDLIAWCSCMVVSKLSYYQWMYRKQNIDKMLEEVVEETIEEKKDSLDIEQSSLYILPPDLQPRMTQIVLRRR